VNQTPSDRGWLQALRRWLASTPQRTFVLYPLLVVAFELVARHGRPEIVPWGVPLLVWGYLQYRLVGHYRMRRAHGGPGIDVPPEHIITTGPYAWVRNPMYLGHLIFMTGLAITFQSWPARALLVFHIVWFHRRVLDDEARLETLFGSEYRDYKARVKRWLPGLF
jgi:protein-S-isoprenylcysteine O-methyltransferase Ste14